MKKTDLVVSKQNNVDAIKYVLGAADVYDDRAADKIAQLSNAIPIQYQDEDGKRSVTAYAHEDTTLETFMKNTLTKRDVLCVLSGLVAVFEIGAQGIPVSYVVKDAAYIYVNKENLSIKAVLIPIKQDVMPLAEIPVFFRDVISNMRFDEMDTDNYVAKLLTAINSDDFSVGKLKSLVDSMLEEMGLFISKENGLMGMSAGGAKTPNREVKVNKLGVINNMRPQGQMNQGQPPMGQMPMNGGQPPMGQMPQMQMNPGQAPQPMAGQPQMGQMPQMPKAPQPMNGGPAPQPMAGQPPMGQMPQMPKAPQPMNGGPAPQPMAGQPPMGQMPQMPKAPQPMNGGQAPMGQMPQMPKAPQPAMNGPIMANSVKPFDDVAEEKKDVQAPEKSEPKVEAQQEEKPEPKVEPQQEQKPEPKVELQPEQKPEPKVELQPEQKPEPKAEPQPEQKPEFTMGNLVGQLGTKPVPHLVRKKTGETINITKSEFTIGKSHTKADYAIDNNTAISRVHCIIVQRDGVNYIKDNNSTNHTFVDGVELQPGKEMLLKNKMTIQLGDEEFTFLLRKGE